jgi:hypothetical protein
MNSIRVGKTPSFKIQLGAAWARSRDLLHSIGKTNFDHTEKLLSAAKRAGLNSDKTFELFEKIKINCGPKPETAFAPLPEALDAAGGFLSPVQITESFGAIAVQCRELAGKIFYVLPIVLNKAKKSLPPAQTKTLIMYISHECDQKDDAFWVLPHVLDAGWNFIQIIDLYREMRYGASPGDFIDLSAALDNAKEPSTPDQILTLVRENAKIRNEAIFRIS